VCDGRIGIDLGEGNWSSTHSDRGDTQSGLHTISIPQTTNTGELNVLVVAAYITDSLSTRIAKIYGLFVMS
jgi:hypothetical protein